MRQQAVRLGVVVSTLLLGACDLAPNPSVPAIDLSSKFKEDGAWRVAVPSDRLPRGAWWVVYKDRTLDMLEPQVDDANPTLAAAYANYQRSQASVQAAKSALYPTVGFGGQLSENRQSDHRPLRSADQPTYYGDNESGVQSSYELDLWGRVHDAIAATSAETQAQADLLETVRLSLHAELARDYAALRGLDHELQLLRTTSKAYKDALSLTQNRLNGKIASPIDVARAQSQVQSAEALIEDAIGRRALIEHAIATLVGTPASSFAIPSAVTAIAVPRGPVAAPSTLLERRPDIAAAERDVAATNENIGVAKTAFYPRFFLNLSAGTQDTGLHLLDLNNAAFSLGPSVSLPLFDGGRRAADLTAAVARRDETAAFYRVTVLKAVQEVEDALALNHRLGLEGKRLDAAVTAETKVLDLSLALYRDGATTYLDVVTAQTTLLEEQRATLVLHTRRLMTSIDLIVALGGGWSVTIHEADKGT